MGVANMANISEDSVAYGMHAHTSTYMTANMYTYMPIYIYICVYIHRYTDIRQHTYLHRRREEGAKTREQGKCSVAAITR